jgi:hypothetical protein
VLGDVRFDAVELLEAALPGDAPAPPVTRSVPSISRERRESIDRTRRLCPLHDGRTAATSFVHQPSRASARLTVRYVFALDARPRSAKSWAPGPALISLGAHEVVGQGKVIALAVQLEGDPRPHPAGSLHGGSR